MLKLRLRSSYNYDVLLRSLILVVFNTESKPGFIKDFLALLVGGVVVVSEGP